MKIKIISTQNLDSRVERREFVVEANRYLLQTMRFDSQEDMWKYFKDFGEYYSPFNLDVESNSREVMILQITDPPQSAIVATSCHVFVMNSQGKTIDKFSIKAH